MVRSDSLVVRSSAICIHGAVTISGPARPGSTQRKIMSSQLCIMFTKLVCGVPSCVRTFVRACIPGASFPVSALSPPRPRDRGLLGHASQRSSSQEQRAMQGKRTGVRDQEGLPHSPQPPVFIVYGLHPLPQSLHLSLLPRSLPQPPPLVLEVRAQLLRGHKEVVLCLALRLRCHLPQPPQSIQHHLT